MSGAGDPGGVTRRALIGVAAFPFLACTARDEVTGALQGASPERGHLLRAPRASAAPSCTERTRVVIAGGGVAGLAAARALRQRGIEDFVLLELEDSAGGNSRGGQRIDVHQDTADLLRKLMTSKQ